MLLQRERDARGRYVTSAQMQSRAKMGELIICGSAIAHLVALSFTFPFFMVGSLFLWLV